MTSVDRVYVFQESTLLDALDEWTNLQVAAYPQQSEKIQWVSAAMLDFLHSPLVERRKMLLGRRYGSA